MKTLSTADRVRVIAALVEGNSIRATVRTRLTNAFSKKAENLAYNLALHYMHYNFCRVHQTLRVTPAMEAGIADHVWEIEELVGLVEAEEQRQIQLGAMKRGKYKPKNSD